MNFKDFIKTNMQYLPRAAVPFAKLFLDSYTKEGVASKNEGICRNITEHYANISTAYYTLVNKSIATWMYSQQHLSYKHGTIWTGQQLTLRRHLLRHIIQQLCLQDIKSPAHISQYMQQYKLRPIKTIKREELNNGN